MIPGARFTVAPGRVIELDGRPIVSVHRLLDGADFAIDPCGADELVHHIVRALNALPLLERFDAASLSNRWGYGAAHLALDDAFRALVHSALASDTCTAEGCPFAFAHTHGA